MKNSLACVTFKGKKSIIFAISLRQLEKWEKLSKCILPETNGCSIVLKTNYFSFQNIIKQLIKSLEEKILIIISNCPIHVRTNFLTALS
jgi:hypothetical protein